MGLGRVDIGCRDMNLDLQECEVENGRGNLSPTISLVGFEAYFIPCRLECIREWAHN